MHATLYEPSYRLLTSKENGYSTTETFLVANKTTIHCLRWTLVSLKLVVEKLAQAGFLLFDAGFLSRSKPRYPMI